MKDIKTVIRKMTQEQTLLATLLEDLSKLKDYMTVQKYFEVGFELHSIMRGLYDKLESDIKKKKFLEADEYDEEEDEDEEYCEEEETLEFWQNRCEDIKKELYQLNEEKEEQDQYLKDFREIEQQNLKRIKDLEEFIEKLLTIDRIHELSINEAVVVLAQSERSEHDIWHSINCKRSNRTYVE